LIHSFFAIAQISETTSFPLKHPRFQPSGELLTTTAECLRDHIAEPWAELMNKLDEIEVSAWDGRGSRIGRISNNAQLKSSTRHKLACQAYFTDYQRVCSRKGTDFLCCDFAGFRKLPDLLKTMGGKWADVDFIQKSQFKTHVNAKLFLIIVQ
jgi:hypothetical protein